MFFASFKQKVSLFCYSQNATYFFITMTMMVKVLFLNPNLTQTLMVKLCIYFEDKTITPYMAIKLVVVSRFLMTSDFRKLGNMKSFYHLDTVHLFPSVYETLKIVYSSNVNSYPTS